MSATLPAEKGIVFFFAVTDELARDRHNRARGVGIASGRRNKAGRCSEIWRTTIFNEIRSPLKASRKRQGRWPNDLRMSGG